MQGILFRLLTLVVLLWVLAGCSAYHLGIRPDEPEFTRNTTVCQEFIDYAKYTQKLQEAYHSRATQNRGWIFVSGTTALGTIATTAALAATSAASPGSLALVPIFGGFLTGVFAMADNPTLADIYTISANRLGTTLREADAMLQTDASGNRYTKHSACASALTYLRLGVTEAKNNLERARTDSAVAAVQRAAAQTQNLNQLAAQIQAQAVTQAVQKGEITKIQPDEVVIGSTTEITLTTSNVNFSSIGFNDVHVLIGNATLSVYWLPADPKTGSYTVKFTAPENPPFEGQLEYKPVLLIGNALTRVESKTDTTLKYKKKP